MFRGRVTHVQGGRVLSSSISSGGEFSQLGGSGTAFSLRVSLDTEVCRDSTDPIAVSIE